METTYDTNSNYSGKARAKNDLADTQASKAASSDEFKNFVADVEDVVKRVANVTDADVARVRAKVQAALQSAKGGLADTAANLKQQARRAAKETDDYVHESPWTAIGIGAAVAAVLGVSVGYLVARR
jgi:ElaB/YqjD/DUF883 family membrane-anchored ribosome-binding protein